jgi:hypothetical protein
MPCADEHYTAAMPDASPLINSHRSSTRRHLFAISIRPRPAPGGGTAAPVLIYEPRARRRSSRQAAALQRMAG